MQCGPSCRDDLPRECCGIVGVFGVENAAEVVYAGLYALQHRGQESAGIVSSDGRRIQSKKGLGLLAEAIKPADLADLPGHIALGHVRYSTTGSRRIQNIQPLVIEYAQGVVAIAHNGNLTNARFLRRLYQRRGSIFQTSTDSEVIVHLLADPQYRNANDPLGQVLRDLKGAYCLAMMDASGLVAARDPHGFRPLSLGELGSGLVVASETCAFDLIGAKFLRDVEPGEIIELSERAPNCRCFAGPDQNRLSRCIFEYIYFARPDSVVFGEAVHNVRRRLGENLAATCPAEADVVCPVPDSGNSAALGYSHRAGIPLDSCFVRNHYVGRTFITPGEEHRALGVKIKLNAVPDAVDGKRLVVVDDSIVRGTTSKARMHCLRAAGAKEVHLRISAPPIRFPCFYGIDFPHAGELIAAEKSVEETREFIGVDSLGYQTVDGLVACVPGSREGYCLACFTGEYPVRVDEDMDKYAMERAARKGRARGLVR